jgi:hypothetical protein
MGGFGGVRPTLSPTTAKTMYWFFGILIGIEFGLCGLRFYFLDIWGGVIMSLIGIFGIFVIRYNFDLQWVVMFGITIFFYGLIHFVMMLERIVIGYGDFLSTSGDPRLFVRDLVFVAAPIVDWGLMGLCIYMYRKMMYGDDVGATYEEQRPLTGAGGGSIVSSGSLVGRTSTTGTISRSNSTFTPFSGTGRRLE